MNSMQVFNVLVSLNSPAYHYAQHLAGFPNIWLQLLPNQVHWPIASDCPCQCFNKLPSPSENSDQWVFHWPIIIYEWPLGKRIVGSILIPYFIGRIRKILRGAPIFISSNATYQSLQTKASLHGQFHARTGDPQFWLRQVAGGAKRCYNFDLAQCAVAVHHWHI